MRPDIPWNVAGIPMEAREAARAAARREGLSVGEWMTRRILRSFSDTTEAPMREAWSTNVSNFTAATEVRPSRRDTEEMLAHVARSESETGEVFRRIEEQLRGVARRLEAAERSQSENNRAMTKAASEINVTAREQAQAFDQLGNSVINLADRLDRVERQGASEGLRDAVKGLHQGLSRLADQISATATQSATQISALAGNLESVAGRIGEVRAEADNTHQTAELRMAQFDERIRALENLVQSGHAAVDRALTSLEARGADDTAAMKREADTASAISRLEDSVSKLRAPAADPALDRRLSGIEHTLSEIANRFDQPNKQSDAIENELRQLAQRIEATETAQRDSVAQLRAELNSVSGRTVEAAPHPAAEVVTHPVEEATPHHIAETIGPISVVEHPAAADETPPFINVLAPDVVLPHEERSGQFSNFDAADSAPLLEEDVPAEHVLPAEETVLADAEHAPDHTAFEADPFAVEAEAPAVEPAAPSTPDSYLAAARRSARDAAAQAESDLGSRIGGFSWGSIADDEEARSNTRKTYFVVAIIALVLILAIAAGAFLSQRIGTASPRSAAPLFHPQKTAPAANVAAPSQRASTAPVVNTVVVPTTGTPPVVTPAQPAGAASAPPAQAASIAPLDKLTALANSGNAKAELIVGLKYLDGDGVAVSEADATKWLGRAALAGQPVAQYRLGTLYERGRGVAADPVKSVHWYALAAQAGNRKAMHNLAVAYASGTGVAKNLPEAARWFAKAAALGLSDSQFNLAVLYERGLGVPQSLVDAYKWYAIAAAAGDTESKARIDALATQLSADDRAAAQRSVDAFHPQPLDAKANVPPQLSEITN
jgi:localization factor PodJL